MRRWLANSARGACMGAADVVPGVSGATVALILGIYPRLIAAVASLGASTFRRMASPSFRSTLFRGFQDPASLRDDADGAQAAHLLLLATVGLGIVPALLAGAHFLPPLLGTHPAQMKAFFLGLVLASAAIPLRELERRGPSRWLLVLGAAIATAWFAGLPEPTGGRARGAVALELAAPAPAEIVLTPANLTLIAPGGGDRPDVAYGLAAPVVVPAGAVRVNIEAVARMSGEAGNAAAGSVREAAGPVAVASVAQPEPFGGGEDPSLLYLFAGGLLAISAMALPGVSGSFVLLLLGLYHFVLHSLSALVSHRDPDALVVVAVFCAAMAIGLLTMVRVLKRLFARWRDGTLAVLAGLMIGSLRKLWPFTEAGGDGGGHGAEVMIWPTAADGAAASAALAFLLGAAAVAVLDAAGRRARRGAG